MSADTTPATATQVPATSRGNALGWLADPQARSARLQSRFGRILLTILSLAIFFTAWQIAGSRVNPILLSSPTAVAKAFWDLLTNGQLAPAFGSAMRDLAIGYGLAAVVGIAVGLVMGRSPVIERMLNPYVNFFQATPLIAVVPLIVIWFGVNLEARVAITFMLGIWSIIINTTTGVKQTPSSLLDVGRIYKLNRRQTITRIQLPNAVPSIFAGLRIGLGKALIGVMIAQMEISVTGLGGLVIGYGDAFKTAYLLAAVATASLVGVVAAGALEVIRKRVFPWTETQDVAGWKSAG